MASSSTSSFLGTAPYRVSAEPRRSRPVRADKRNCTTATLTATPLRLHGCTSWSSARATNEAVLSLLGAQHCRHNFGEESRRKNLQGKENHVLPVLR